MIRQNFEIRSQSKFVLISSLLIISIYLFSSCSGNQYLYCGAGDITNYLIINIDEINYNAVSDSIRISGEIQDSLMSEPLIGVNVFIIGTTISTATNFDGKFKLALKYNPKDSLKFTYVGYTPQSYILENFLKEQLRIKD